MDEMDEMDEPRGQIVVATTNAHKVAEISAIAGAFGYEVVSRTDAGVPDDFHIEESGETFEENSMLKARAVFDFLEGRVAALADDSGLCVDALGGAPGVHSARFADEGGGDAANNEKLLRLLADGKGGGVVPCGGRGARFVSVVTLILPEVLPADKAGENNGAQMDKFPNSSDGGDGKGASMDKFSNYSGGGDGACGLRSGVRNDSGGVRNDIPLDKFPNNSDGGAHGVGGGVHNDTYLDKFSNRNGDDAGEPEIIVCRGEVEGYIAFHETGNGGFGYDPLFIPTTEELKSAGLEKYEGLSFGVFRPEDKNKISHRFRALEKLRDALKGK